MEVKIAVDEIMVIGAVICAMMITVGIVFGRIPAIEGGAIVVSLCGGAVIVKITKATRRGRNSDSRRSEKKTGQ